MLINLLTYLLNIIQYDTIQYHYIYVRPKANSQINLTHGTKQKRVMKQTKSRKRHAQKKQPRH